MKSAAWQRGRSKTSIFPSPRQGAEQRLGEGSWKPPDPQTNRLRHPGGGRDAQDEGNAGNLLLLPTSIDPRRGERRTTPGKPLAGERSVRGARSR